MKSTFFALLLCALPIDAWGKPWEEVILEVSTLNGVVLSEPLIGQIDTSSEPRLFLPILDLAKVLGVLLEQPGPGLFKMYLNQIDSSTIDFNRCGQTDPPKDCEYFLEQRGVYFLSSDYLQNILAWPLDVDLKNMRITITASDKSPRQLEKKNPGTEKPVLIQRQQNGSPAARVEVLISDNSNNNLVNLYQTQPLLQHDSDLLVSRDSEETALRWTISKELVESTAPWTPKIYELISTQTLDTKYLFSPTQIVGFNLSNIRRNENIFDTQNLYEKGPPRWKAELFVNEVYFGETNIDSNGNFSFTNIPVFYGPNKIRYQLTSPLGQTLQILRDYNVGAEFIGGGRLKYQAAFGQRISSSDLIGSGIVNYGVTQSLNAQLGWAQFKMQNPSETEKKFRISGLSYLQPRYSMNLTQMQSLEGDETAWVLSPKMMIGPVFINSEYAHFENFRTRLVNNNPGDNQTAFKKISGLVSLQEPIPTTGQLSFQESNYTSFGSSYQAQMRLYTYLLNSSILIESNKFWPSPASPDLYVEAGKYGAALRGRWGVLIQDDHYAKTRLQLESLLRREYYLTFSMEAPRRLSDGSVSLGLSKLLGEIQIETNVTHSEAATFLGVALSSNFKMTPRGLQLSQEENYRQAQLEIFSFIDENSNNLFDPEEKPYSKLRILHVQRQKEYETNQNGVVTIPNINPYQRLSLAVVKESISNIFLTAEDFKNDYFLTPAQQLRIEVPVKPSFDVRGTLKNSFFKKLVPIEIVDSSEKLIASTTTSTSGSYRFSDLPGGIYFIRINTDFLNKNDLLAEPAVLGVELTGKAGMRSVEDILVRSASPGRNTDDPAPRDQD